VIEMTTNDRIRLQKTSDLGFTAVPDSFIDNYMMTAPGEYVKIYLYLLRCVDSKEAYFTMEKTANAFGTSEADIRRGLLYWEQQGLLSLEFDNGSLRAIHFGKISSESAAMQPAGQGRPDLHRGDVPNYTLPEIRAFLSDNDFAQLQFITESYIKRPLQHKDLCYLLYWNKSLGFSADLIIYLIEISVENAASKESSAFSHIHRTALNWYQNGVKTQADVKLLLQADSNAKSDRGMIALVKKAMGLNERSLNDEEEATVAKWAESWNFSSDLICEACRRSVARTHQPSFEYANTILENWQKLGIKTMDGVAQQDKLFREKTASLYAAPAEAKQGKKAATENQTYEKKQKTTPQKFQNFKGRSNNYDEIEHLLISNM
jgi:DnaD/phage-associated family protein